MTILCYIVELSSLTDNTEHCWNNSKQRIPFDILQLELNTASFILMWPPSNLTGLAGLLILQILMILTSYTPLQ